MAVCANRRERLNLGSPSRAPVARWAVLVGLVAAAGAVALTLSSDHVRYRWADALFLADNIAGFSAAGAYWLVRRPASLLGPALLATAVTWVLVALQSADGSLVFSLAVLADWPLAVATFYTLLAFPSGRLTGRVDRAVLVLVLSASPCSSSRTSSSRRSRPAVTRSPSAGACAHRMRFRWDRSPRRRWSTSARRRRSAARSPERLVLRAGAPVSRRHAAATPRTLLDRARRRAVRVAVRASPADGVRRRCASRRCRDRAVGACVGPAAPPVGLRCVASPRRGVRGGRPRAARGRPRSAPEPAPVGARRRRCARRSVTAARRVVGGRGLPRPGRVSAPAGRVGPRLAQDRRSGRSARGGDPSRSGARRGSGAARGGRHGDADLTRVRAAGA